MSHDSLLFNTDDLILLMAAAQYLLLAVLLFAIRNRNDRSHHLLAFILIITALESIDTLLIWSPTLRVIVLDRNPNLLFLGGFGYWLQGPLLMIYVKSVLYREYRFRVIDYIHFIPLFVVIYLLITHYYCLPSQQQRQIMTNQDLMWTPLIEHLITGRHISIISYASWSLFLLARYRAELQQHYANLETIERRWLFWV